MTTRSKTRKAPAKAADPKSTQKRDWSKKKIAAFAALELGPIDDVTFAAIESAIGTNDEWANRVILCRLALALMYRTKTELINSFDKDGDLAMDLLERMQHEKVFFDGLSGLFGAVVSRLLVAGTAASEAA